MGRKKRRMEGRRKGEERRRGLQLIWHFKIFLLEEVRFSMLWPAQGGASKKLLLSLLCVSQGRPPLPSTTCLSWLTHTKRVTFSQFSALVEQSCVCAMAHMLRLVYLQLARWSLTVYIEAIWKLTVGQHNLKTPRNAYRGVLTCSKLRVRNSLFNIMCKYSAFKNQLRKTLIE